MSKRYYLAGPMTGYPNNNVPTFISVRDKLVSEGWDVVLPVDIDHTGAWSEGATWFDYLGADIALLGTVDGIIFLSGWEKSRGARLEAMTGILTNKEFFEYGDPIVALSKNQVLQEIYNNTWQKITTDQRLKRELQLSLSLVT